MSNTYKLDYKRSVLRGVSDLISTTSMLAMKIAGVPAHDGVGLAGSCRAY